ncbi:hypothetical protein KY362_07195 [Candidatus Woesearchaeota archaeon]|nr:hypothetical protein [Candidatus Woesearchaeota archaeon]
MKDKPRRNYLLLGASFLIVGVIIEYTTMRLLHTNLSAYYKTAMVMLMIVMGYSFAESVIARSARASLSVIQHPFVKIAGPRAGKALFYILLYAALFVIYLLVFIYGFSTSELMLQTNFSSLA